MIRTSHILTVFFLYLIEFTTVFNGNIALAADLQTTPSPPSSSLAPSISSASIKVANGILFKLKKDASVVTSMSKRNQSIKQIENVVNTQLQRHGLTNTYALSRKKRSLTTTVFYAETDASQTNAEVLSQLKNDPNVEWAEENILRDISATNPNDTYWNRQQSYMTGSNLTNAWDISRGSKEVVIGIIDTGVDYTHPDLSNNIWINPGEIPGDGIDNDSNGFIDDVNGWDFVSVSSSYVAPNEDPGPRDNDPMDVQSHGTHVAGIVAAEGNNNIGVAGVSWNSRIMPLRAGFMTTSGGGALATSDIVAALYYACDNGADIINMSFGGYGPSKSEEIALDYCADLGVFLVAAAGNSNTDASLYPAAFENVFSVAASGSDINSKASFSNYGISVDIMAPGLSIYSTLPGGGYGQKSGTSMASPFIAGLAALLKSNDPSASSQDLKYLLWESAHKVKSPAIDKLGAGAAIASLYKTMDSLQPRIQLASIASKKQNDALENTILRPSIRNFSSQVKNITLKIVTSDPYLTILDDTINVNNVMPEKIVTNWDDTWVIAKSLNTPINHTAKYTVHLYEGSSTSEIGVEEYSIQINPSKKTVANVTPNIPGVTYYSPQLIDHPDGKLSMFLEGRNEFPYHIYHRVRNLEGQWGNYSVVHPGTNFQYSGELSAIVDSLGVIHAAFSVREATYDEEVYYGRFDSSLGENASWEISPLTNGAGLHLPNVVTQKIKIALSSDEKPIVLWSDARHGSSDIFWRHFDGVSWSAEEKIYDNPIEVSVSHGVINFSVNKVENGNLVTLIRHRNSTNDSNTNENRFMTFDGINWSSPQLLSLTSRTRDPVVDDSGILHLAYNDTSGYMIHISYINSTWTLPKIIHRGSSYPGLITNEIGGVDYIYFSGSGLEYKKFLWRSRFDGEKWNAPELIYTFLEEEIFEQLSYIDIIRTGKNELLYLTSYPQSSGEVKVISLSESVSDEFSTHQINVVDAGDFTNTAKLTASVLPEISTSNFSRYQYSISSAPDNIDQRNWISFSPSTPINFNFSNYKKLVNAQQYFVNVKAQRQDGSTTNVLSSNGIYYFGPNASPKISILSPAFGDTFSDNIIPQPLKASAFDAEDGDLSENVAWLSNIDGPFTSVDALSPGEHRLTASVIDTGGLSASDFVNVTVEAMPNSLSGSTNTALSLVNLTNEGTLDWVHWGLNSAGDMNRKAGVTKQISNLVTINGGSLPRGTNNTTRYSWSDGSPTVSIINTNTAVRAYGERKGFSFNVPADTSQRTLTVYLGAKNVSARLEAYLSDNPTQIYTTQIERLSGVTSQAVTLDFSADTPGQTLIVRYVLENKPGSTGWISIEAATLKDSLSNINLPPSILSSPVTSVIAGEAYTYDVEATDSNINDTLAFSLNTAPIGMSIDANTGLISWTPTSSQIGDNNVEVVVNDDQNPQLFDTQSFIITVETAAVNVAPVIISDPVNSAYVGLEYQYLVKAKDDNPNDELTFSLPTYHPIGMHIDPISGLITWTPTIDQVGRHLIGVQVTDNGNPNLSTSQSISLEVFEAGKGLLDGNVLTAPSNIDLTTKGSIDWVHWGLTSASDANHKTGGIAQISNVIPIGGAKLPRGTNNLTRYSWNDGSPALNASNTNAGIRVYGEGKGFEFMVRADTSPRMLTIYLGAKNVRGRIEATLSDKSAPVYSTPIEKLSGVTSQAITLNFQAASAGQLLSIRYTLESKPGSTGWISLEAAALEGSANGNLRPSIITLPKTNATVGELYTYGVEAVDQNINDTLTFALNTAPSGMTINATTGLISWTPTASQTGKNDVEVIVSDNGIPKLTDTQSFIINVEAVSGNVAPVITSTPVLDVYEGAEYLYQVQASDANIGDILTYSLSTFPNDMNIDPATGLIRWSPKPGQVGSHLVTVMVIDNGEPILSSTQSYSVEVLASGDSYLVGFRMPAPSNINLSSNGISEWVHWGLNDSADVNRKANAATNINDISVIGGGSAQHGKNNLTRYSWTGGSPTVNVTNTNGGVRVYKESKGFEFKVPADINPRTLTVYLGAKNVSGRFEAFLSNSNKPIYVANIEQLSGVTSQAIALIFHHASIGQTLTVRYVLDHKPGSTGWISLEAATLN